MGLFSGVSDFASDLVGGGSDIVDGLTGKAQRDAGSKAEEIAQLNATLVRKEMNEQIKRLKAQQAQVFGAAVARQGASGIEMGAGTTDDFLREMKQSFRADIDWRRESGKRQVEVVREGGSLVNQQAVAAGWGTAASTAMTIASMWI